MSFGISVSIFLYLLTKTYSFSHFTFYFMKSMAYGINKEGSLKWKNFLLCSLLLTFCFSVCVIDAVILTLRMKNRLMNAFHLWKKLQKYNRKRKKEPLVFSYPASIAIVQCSLGKSKSCLTFRDTWKISTHLPKNIFNKQLKECFQFWMKYVCFIGKNQYVKWTSTNVKIKLIFLCSFCYKVYWRLRKYSTH